MRKAKKTNTAQSAILDCQVLKESVVKFDSGNAGLINLVAEVEELLQQISVKDQIRQPTVRHIN